MNEPQAAERARPSGDGEKAASSAKGPGATSSGRAKWNVRSFVLWGAVALVLAGIVVIIVLCIKGRTGGNTKPHPSTELQIAMITRRPQGDSRKYQFTTLPNGLQVLNVEDGSSKTSAYSMAVKAGSFDDPPELPGLAHFCEHMLFLGTKTYPDPSGYDNFVSSNGGYLNAYTAEETTVYYTELSSSAAGEGLQRFADFFRAPLFSEEYVEREVHAIDSEHAKNVQDPAWRVNQVMSSFANEGSPVRAFHTGNMQTLYDLPRQNGTDPVERLRGWFSEHYCPSRYHLVTYGPDSLEKQLESVYEDFSEIPKGSGTCQGERQSWAEPEAWTYSSTGHWAVIQGMQPQSELIVFFPLPDISKEYLSQPLQYIDYTIVYGGEMSFIKIIRDTLGLASSVGVSAESTSAGTGVYFSCRLAQAGREHPGLVLDLLFQYLHMLRTRGVDMGLYFSLANVSKLSWDWAQAKGAADTASDLAERMTRLPPNRLLSGDDLIEEPNAGLVADLMAKLDPRRMNVGLIDPDASKHLFGSKEVHTAPYYGTKYTLSTVEDQVPGALRRWQAWKGMNETEVAEQVAAMLERYNLSRRNSTPPVPKPPEPISGVSSDFNLDHMRARKAVMAQNASDRDQQLFGPRPRHIEDEQEELTRPDLGGQDPSGKQPLSKPGAEDAEDPEKKGKHQITGPSRREAWYRAGWVNPSPKAQMQFLLRPRIHPDDDEEVLEADALSSLRLGFYTSLLAEELVPKLFDLAVAGASFDIGLSAQGGGGALSLSFEGFPPLLPRLIRQAVKEIDKSIKVKDHMSRFERIYEEYDESFRDYSSMPVDYALADRNLLLTPGQHSQEESLMALANVTPSSVESAPDQLVKSRPLDLTALIMGNLDLQEAEDAVDWVMDGLSGVQSTTGVHQGHVQHLPPVVRPAQPIELRKRNPREGDGNDATVVSLIAGVATVESRAILGLIGQILNVLAYNDLRTERQLGYVVSAGVGQISNVQYISIIVQGDTHRADEMEMAVENVFFRLMPQRLRNLTKDEFQTYKDSFRQQLLQPPVGRSEEFSHYWSHIMNRGECFGLLSEMLDFLDQNLTSKALLQEAWDAIVLPKKGHRLKVAVKYFAGEVVPRPAQNEVNVLWHRAGLSMEVQERLSMEYEKTKVLDEANSTVRKAIAKNGGYFPTTLYCKRMAKEDKKQTTHEGKQSYGKDMESIPPDPNLVRRPGERYILQRSGGSSGASSGGSALLQHPADRGRRGGRQFLQPED